MARYKNQHYVPKFYFRLFSKNKKTICLYVISKNKFVEHANIKNQCSKSYFYSKNTNIEKKFSQLEGLAKNILTKIIKNNSLDELSNREIENLKSYILFQYGRTKFIKDRANDLANHLFDLSKPGMYDNAKKAGEDYCWESIKNTKIEMNPNYIVLLSIISNILLIDMKMCLLENKSQMDFIFSDNPVVFFNSFFNDKYPYGTTGFSSRGLQIFFPINSKLMLFLYDSDFYEVKFTKINKTKDIQRLNGLQIFNCDNNIYFENWNIKDKILERFNQLKSKRPKNKNEYEVMIRLLRASAPKIKYNLEKLSFLKHIKTDRHYGVRRKDIYDIYKKVIKAIENKKIKSAEELKEFLKNLEI